MNDKKQVVPQRTVLILQGGGALGAFQGGVFEALDGSGLAPDWVIGTSIGAINAAIIAGNRPARRLEKLYEFWARIGQEGWSGGGDEQPAVTTFALGTAWQAWCVATMGLPNFFVPRWWQGFALGLRVPPQLAGHYDTTPLRRTLEELVDFDYLNDGPTRIAVGAVDVESGAIRYFDSARDRICVEHILASSALPPAFPAIEIDGHYYWDGGLHSNTPLEWMLRDEPRRHTLCFLATLWPCEDSAPTTLLDVMRRSKELQYASRADTLLALEQEAHRLRHGISVLAGHLPAELRQQPVLDEIIRQGCRSTYHVIRLQAPRLVHDTHAKDIDFATSSIQRRWDSGRHDALVALAAKPWERPVGAEEGVVLHAAGTETTAAMRSDA